MFTRLFSIFALLIAVNCQSQDKWYRLEKRDIFAASTAFLAGSFEGTAETLKWHYDEFESVFPNADETYWNPEISWQNKYADGTPESGPRYFGSTTFLAWTTDGYHLMRTGRNLMFGATFFLSPKKEFDWRTTLLRIAVYSLSYQAGFHLTYTLIFK
jgi:hypothetical protein